MENYPHVKLFEGVSRKDRALLDHIGTTVTVKAGRHLSDQGVANRQFAVVLEGELSVQRDGAEIARVGHGDCVGEIALLTGPGAPATATVEAVGDTTVWVLSRSEFNQLVREVPVVSDRLAHVALTRIASNDAP